MASPKQILAKEKRVREIIVAKKAREARAFLYIHGFLPDGEDRAVRARINKFVEKLPPQ
jgi:hypothetical protein